MPGITGIADNFHTAVITTHDENKIPGAIHKSVHPENARSAAEAIIDLAFDAYSRRNPNSLHIPEGKETCIVGFSVESILDVLTPDQPGRPAQATDRRDRFRRDPGGGAVRRLQHDANRSGRELSRSWAASLPSAMCCCLRPDAARAPFAKDGLMTQQAVADFAGPGLKGVLTKLGEVAGLEGPLPLVFHMGSCVDNSRAVTIATALAEKLDVDLSDLPIVASAPEAMAEKAVAIGSWSVALGFPTHLGNIPQIMGSDQVVSIVTETAKDLFGGYFLVEPGPHGRRRQAVRRNPGTPQGPGL